MKFNKHKFSNRFPALDCAIFVMHQPSDPGRYELVGGGHLSYAEYRATGAAIILPDGAVYVGVSVCSPEDQFVKATGRSKAIGRAFQAIRKASEPFRVQVGSDSQNPIPLIKSYIENSIAMKKVDMGLL